MSDCPTDADLTTMIGETFQVSLNPLLTKHLQTCRQCRRRLDQLDRFFHQPTVSPPQPSTNLAGNEHESSEDSTSAEEDELDTNAIESVLANPSHLPLVPGYELVTEIGRGGMGIVYLARHRQLNRRTALKMVLNNANSDPVNFQRFVFEAEVLARVQHPQIIQIYEAGSFITKTGEEAAYLAMEYLDGGSLAAYAKRFRPLPPRQAAELVEGLARAIHVAHLQGVIHRDLKPTNILRTREGVFKVSDFGLAKMSSNNAELTAAGLVVGTPAYMAPEQAAGNRSLGPSIDIYALGAILFELLTGRTPFVGEDAMALVVQLIRDEPPDVNRFRPKLPRDLAAITMRAIARAPEHRYQSAEGLADDLRRYLDGGVVQARPVGTVTKITRWAYRHPLAAFSIFGFILVTAVWLSLLYWQWYRAQARVYQEQSIRLGLQAELDKVRGELSQQSLAAKQDRRELAYSLFSQAIQHCETGERTSGLDKLLDCLNLAISLGDSEFERVIRVHLADWAATDLVLERSLSLPEARSVIASPDESLVLVRNAQQQLEIREMVSGKLLAVTPADASPQLRQAIAQSSAQQLAISPDHAHLALSWGRGQIFLWQLPRLGSLDSPYVLGEPKAIQLPGNSQITALKFATPETIWVASQDGYLRNWTLKNAQLLVSRQMPVLQTHGRFPFTLDPIDQSIWFVDRQGQVRSWNPTRQATKSIGFHEGRITHLQLSPDGRYLVTLAADGTLKLWRTNSAASEDSQLMMMVVPSKMIGFSQDSQRLLIVGADGQLRIWDVNTHATTLVPLQEIESVDGFVPLPTQNQLLILSGGRLHWFQIPNQRARTHSWSTLNSSRGKTAPALMAVQQTESGTFGVWRSEEKLLRVSIEKPEQVPEEYTLHGKLLRIQPMAGGQLLLSYPEELVLLDQQCQLLQRASWPQHLQVKQVLPIGSGQAVLLFENDSIARWQLSDSQEVDYLVTLDQSDKIGAGAINSAGTEFLFSIGRHLHFRKTQTNEQIRPPIQFAAEITMAEYSPEGQRVLVALKNNTAEIWDLRSGAKRIRMLSAGPFNRIAWIGNSETIITATRDGRVSEWDCKTGLPLRPRTGIAGEIVSTVFEPRNAQFYLLVRDHGDRELSLVRWTKLPSPLAGAPDELAKRLKGSANRGNITKR